MSDQSTSAAPRIVRSRLLRCLLTALFNVGVLVAALSVFDLAAGSRLVMLAVLILGVAFCGAQIHERLIRLGCSV